MKYVLAAIILAALSATSATAQCTGGVCRAPLVAVAIGVPGRRMSYRRAGRVERRVGRRMVRRARRGARRAARGRCCG
jgi:hypothetical protein